jgi:hypothetical protein
VCPCAAEIVFRGGWIVMSGGWIVFRGGEIVMSGRERRLRHGVKAFRES